jgi:hypothetical protein
MNVRKIHGVTHHYAVLHFVGIEFFCPTVDGRHMKQRNFDINSEKTLRGFMYPHHWNELLHTAATPNFPIDYQYRGFLYVALSAK